MKIIRTDNFTQIKADFSRSTPFFAYIVSSWHLDNLIAYLLLNKLKGGVVIIQPQSNIKNDTRFRLTEDKFARYEYLFNKIYFLNTAYIKIDLFSIIARCFFVKKSCAYLIVPDSRLSIRVLSSLLYLNLTFNYILIDEGLGCYLPYENFLSYGNTNHFKQKINNIVYMLFVKPIIKKICNTVCDFRFYKLKNDKLVCNNTISVILNNIYKDRNRSKRMENGKNILIFKDFGVVDTSIIAYVYSHILNYFQKTEYHIYIKRHPNDVDEQFESFLNTYNNVTLLNTEQSGEELMSIYFPMVILGGYTTVLFSSANIFNVSAISFMKIYLNFNNIDKIVKKNIDFFIEKFTGNAVLMFPSSFEELFDLFEKHLSN
jgi:hypothetical protein